MIRFSLRRLIWAGPFSAVAATIANLFYYTLTRRFGEKYLVALGGPGSPAMEMPPPFIVVATLLLAFGAMLIFALLLKIARTPIPPFLSIAITFLLISFGGPFSIPGEIRLSTKLLLCGMHFLSAAIIIGGILYFSREK